MCFLECEGSVRGEVARSREDVEVEYGDMCGVWRMGMENVMEYRGEGVCTWLGERGYKWTLRCQRTEDVSMSI